MTKPWGPKTEAVLGSLWWIVLLVWLFSKLTLEQALIAIISGVYSFSIAYLGVTIGLRSSRK